MTLCNTMHVSSYYCKRVFFLPFVWYQETYHVYLGYLRIYSIWI